MPTTNTRTIKPSGGDYTSLSNWEAGRDDYGDLVTLDTIEVAELYAGTTETAFTISGWTTSATQYIKIVASASDRHVGVWDDNKAKIVIGTGSLLTISEDYVYLDGLQIRKTSTSADYQNLMNIGSQTAGSNSIRISNCILRQAGNDSYVESGIRGNSINLLLFVWNTIIYNVSRKDAPACGCNDMNAGTFYVYNCTLIGGRNGLTPSYASIAKNCYVGGSYGAAYNGSITKTTCASSDTTGSTGLQNIAVNTTNFTNVTAGSEDFRLPSGSALINAGTDTSGDSTPLNFTTEIQGETRSTWDIGADEYVAAGGGSVSASVSATLDGVSGSALASATVSASMASTLDGVSGSASAAVTVNGSAAASLGGAAGPATASVTVTGSASTSLDGASGSASVQLGLVTITAAVSASLGGASGSASASVTVQGSASGSLAGAEGSAAGSVTITATAAAVLDGATGSASDHAAWIAPGLWIARGGRNSARRIGWVNRRVNNVT